MLAEIDRIPDNGIDGILSIYYSALKIAISF